MKVLKRNVSKDEFKKFLNNINLEDKKLYEEVTKHQDFIFQFSGGTASRMVADARPENFDDMICLNSYSRPGASFGFGNFCLIKNEGQKSVYPPQIQPFIEDGRGTICFQEQVMAIGNYLTDGKYNGDTWRRLLKKLGKAKKAPEDLEKWGKMVACAKEVGAQKGISAKDIDLLCDDLLTLSAYSFNKSHAAAYSYLAMETAYLAKYFKPFFYAINLVNKAGDDDDIKAAIKSCKNSGFNVAPPDINNSREHFFPKNGILYFGINEIKGVGEKASKAVVENQPYDSIIDFICKIIGKGVNKTATTALIGSGAFDSIIGDKRSYYMKVAELFYDRKKDKKIPELLKQIWEDCEKELTEYSTTVGEYMDFENKYFGGVFFSGIFSDKMKAKIDEIYKKGMCLRNFQEVRDKNLPNAMVPVEIVSSRLHVDKNGNDMIFTNVRDCEGEEASIPIFASYFKFLKERFDGPGFYFMSVFENADGNIMFGSRNWVNDEGRKSRMLLQFKVK